MARYTYDFKVDALRLSDEVGIAAAARQLGISYETMAKWRKTPWRNRLDAYSDSLKFREDTTMRMESLERENSELRQANALLLETIRNLSAVQAR